MKAYRYRCPLDPWVGEPSDPEALKRHGWRDQGILVVAPEDPRLNWMEQQLLTEIAERLYGRRKVANG